MIKVWYEPRYCATMAHHEGVTVRVYDTARVSCEKRKLFQSIDEIGTKAGVGARNVPFREELWEVFLEIGEVLDE